MTEVKSANERVQKIEKEKIQLEKDLVDKKSKPPQHVKDDANRAFSIEENQQLKD